MHIYLYWVLIPVRQWGQSPTCPTWIFILDILVALWQRSSKLPPPPPPKEARAVQELQHNTIDIYIKLVACILSGWHCEWIQNNKIPSAVCGCILHNIVLWLCYALCEMHICCNYDICQLNYNLSVEFCLLLPLLYAGNISILMRQCPQQIIRRPSFRKEIHEVMKLSWIWARVAHSCPYHAKTGQ